MHQKSWHVWRMDNRLKVERDELKHGKQEREKGQVTQKAAFDGKVKRLRCAATGLSLPEVEVQQSMEGIGQSSSSTASPNDESGSPKHINLFEEAEQAEAKHIAEHEKRMGYQRRNNELAGVSKGALISEFDEARSLKPWYLEARSKPVEADARPQYVLLNGLTSDKPKDKKEKGDKKHKKERDKKDHTKQSKKHRQRGDSDLEELTRLRFAREEREQQERARTLSLLGR